jgi:hypothetical protein
MHISPNQFASVQGRWLQKYAGATVLCSQPTLLQTTVRRLRPREQLLCARQHARCQAVFKCGRGPDQKIALNPYKLAISLQRCLIKKLACAKRNWR